MTINTVSPEQLLDEDRMDPGFFLHPAIHRNWTVPTRPLSEVAEVARNKRVQQHVGEDPILDTDERPPTIDPVVKTRKTDDRTYLQWVRPGDVLLHRGRQRFCVCVDQKCLASYDFWVIRCGDSLKPAFLALCLRCKYIQDEINRRSTGHVQNRIPKNELERLPLPVPDPDRQDELIAQYREQVGDVEPEQDLLTMVDRLSERLGYVDSPPGSIRVVSGSQLRDRLDPAAHFSTRYRYRGEAERVSLDSLADVQRTERQPAGADKSDRPEEWEGPRIRAQDLSPLLIQPDDADDRPRRSRRRRETHIPCGTILMDQYYRDRLRVGYVLREEGVVLTSNMYKIEPDENRVDPMYLAAFLSTRPPAEQLRHEIPSTSSDRTRIRTDALRSLEVPLPDRERQDELLEQLRPMHRRRQTLADGPPPENDLLRKLLEQ